MSRIFISHSTVNNASALAIAQWLEELGWADYFLDISIDQGLLPGERWQQALRIAADRCEAVLFLISPAWLASRWCLAEFLLAKQLGKPIFGVLVEPTLLDTLPKEMTAEWQLCDLVTGVERRVSAVGLDSVVPVTTVSLAEAGLSRLKLGLERAGVRATTFEWPPPDDPRRPPYQGLKPLDVGDAAVFFGREAAIVRGLDALRSIRERGIDQMLVILGASGAGKSSYLRAGLWPRLARDDRQFLPIPVVRPGRAVLTGPTGLVVSLEGAFKQRGRPKNRADILNALRQPSGLADQLTELQTCAVRTLGDHASVPTVVIPVDQGEELFGPEGRTENESFLTLLLGALLSADVGGSRDGPDSARPITLLGLRSEALGRFQEEQQLASIGRVLFGLDPLPTGALKAVIEGPAERSSAAGRQLVVDPDLTEQLLNDAVGADALPLLAFTLERLFLNYGSDGRLSLSDYEALGKIRGAIGAAIEAAFDDPTRVPVIPSDETELKVVLRQAFIPWLAIVDPNTAERYRRVAKWDEIPSEARPILERLIKARLLVRDMRRLEVGATNTIVVEIAHEALLRQWPVLNGWLEEESQALRVLEGVRRAASEWAATGRGISWLIHEGERLEQARALVDRADFLGLLGQEGRDYIEVCRAREMATYAEREAVRVEREQVREREIENARRLALAAARVKRRSYVAAALALGVAILSTLAGLAFLNAREAGQAAQEAAETARATAIVRTAAALPDSTTSGMVLATLRASYEPEGLVALAARAVQGARATAILRGHELDVLSVGFSPDGKQIITGSTDGTARVWRADGTGNPIVFRRMDGEVESASFSPDGARVVTAGEDGTAQIWRADGTGDPVVLQGHDGSVWSASFSRDGEHVLTTGEDGTARVWPVDGRREVVVLDGGDADIKAAFSPDGSRVVMSCEDAAAHVRRADGTGTPVILRGHGDSIQAVTFSPDRTHVATASADNTARVWRADGTGQSIVLRGHTARVSDVAFSPDGARVVTASADNTARVWRADGVGEAVVLRGHNGEVNNALFSPDGTHVVTVSDDGTARVWRADGIGTPIALRGDSPITSVTFSPDSGRVVSGEAEGIVRVWQLQPTDEPAVLRGHQGTVTSLAFSPDGARVVTVGVDRTIRLWRSDGTSTEVVLTTTDVVRRVSFSANGANVVTATANGLVRLLRVDGTRTTVLKESDASISALAFSGDGSRFITAHKDSTVRVWSTDTPATPIVFKGGRQIHVVAFSADGSRVVAGGDNDSFVWPADGKGAAVEIDVLQANVGSGVSAVAVSSNGTLVATVNADGRARVWGTPGTEGPVILRGYEGRVLAVAFSADGKQLVTTGDDGTARVWRSDGTGDAVVLTGHDGHVVDAVFSTDGKRLVTAGADGTARIWRLTWPELLTVLRSATTACLTTLQRRVYLGEDLAAAKTAWEHCEAQYGRGTVR